MNAPVHYTTFGETQATLAQVHGATVILDHHLKNTDIRSRVGTIDRVTEDFVVVKLYTGDFRTVRYDTIFRAQAYIF